MQNKQLTEEDVLALSLGRTIIGGLRDAGVVNQQIQVPKQAQMDSNATQQSALFG